jgi:hypothetical protein
MVVTKLDSKSIKLMMIAAAIMSFLVARILPNGSRPVSASSLATSGITDTPVSNPLSPKASFGKISAEAIKMAISLHES